VALKFKNRERSVEGLAVIVIYFFVLHLIFEVAPPWVPATVLFVTIFGGGAFALSGLGRAFWDASLPGKFLGASVVFAIWVLAGRPGRSFFKKKKVEDLQRD
jgi:hypothetical protein